MFVGIVPACLGPVNSVLYSFPAMPTKIEQQINTALKRRRVSSSADLEGFVIDAHYFLTELGRFANVKVKKTGDPRAAVVLSCSAVESSRSIGEIAETLERIWTEELAYFGGPEQHQTRVEQGQIELRFMSEAEPEDFFVTGRIVVDLSALTSS